MLGIGIAAYNLHVASDTTRRGGMPLCFANRILCFANGDVEYLLGKLDGVAWTLRHEPEYRTGQAVILGYELSN
jgi:hypothetical protein